MCSKMAALSGSALWCFSVSACVSGFPLFLCVMFSREKAPSQIHLCPNAKLKLLLREIFKVEKINVAC